MRNNVRRPPPSPGCLSCVQEVRTLGQQLTPGRCGMWNRTGGKEMTNSASLSPHTPIMYAWRWTNTHLNLRWALNFRQRTVTIRRAMWCGRHGRSPQHSGVVQRRARAQALASSGLCGSEQGVPFSSRPKREHNASQHQVHLLDDTALALHTYCAPWTLPLLGQPPAGLGDMQPAKGAGDLDSAL